MRKTAKKENGRIGNTFDEERKKKEYYKKIENKREKRKTANYRS